MKEGLVRGNTVIELVASQVERRPDAPALSFAGAELTYRQLWEGSGAVAAALADCGVRRDMFVGLMCERSFELVIGLLGTLRAGAAYIPLEPTYPAKRLEMMIDDSAPAAILVTGRHEQQARQLTTAPLISLDTLPRSGSGDAKSPQPNTAAYVLYTSGSTGRPKGVVIEHWTLLNRLDWMQRYFEADARDTILHKTPFSFDVSVWELVLPLMVGAKMVIAKPGGHADADYVARLIEDEQVTLAHFVPSMLRAFCGYATRESCRSLRALICSGEVLPVALALKARDSLETDVYNLYGPTEATIDVTSWRVQGDEHLTVPIGYPIDNVDVIILGPSGEPCQAGVEGEIVIAGQALAREYLNLEDMTAERFPTLMLSGRPTRVYRTGDLGIRREDGAIEFVGRIDSQVKIRGYRIELGEVERALLAQHGVIQAVVLAVESGTSTSLAAYIVPLAGTNGPATSVRALRDGIRDLLPDYMVPASIRLVEAVPVTAHGKVDVQALRRAEEGEPPSSGDTGANASPQSIEQALIAIWEEVLHVENLTPDADFFELGGDSLSATVLAVAVGERISRLAAWPVEPKVALFQWPTIRELAAAIDRGDLR